MSTHRHSLRGYRNTCVPLFLVRCGLLLALQLWVASSSVAFASAAHSMTVSATPNPTPTSAFDQGFALAKVSVVRLLVSYIDPTDSNKAIPACTGLGVLVKSFNSATATPNDWILTDGSLVNQTQALCADGQPMGTLSQVQVYFNTASKVENNSPPLVSPPIMCSDPAHCSSGPALISFQGAVLPFLDLASSQRSSGDRAIALTNTSGKFPTANDVAASDAPFFVTPQLFDAGNPDLEAGTPLIDTTGHLTGLRSAKAAPPIKLDVIASLIARIPNNKQAGNNPTPTATPVPAGTFVVPGTSVALEWWQWMTLVLLLLILVILLTALVIRSRRAQTSRLSKAEWDEAERRSVIEAREIETMEAARRAWEEHQKLSEQPTFPVQPQGLQDKTVVRKTAPDLRCPRCGEPVVHDANYCPNCSLLLSPSESGLHLRVRPPSSSVPAQSPVSSNPFASSNARTVPPNPNTTPASTFPMIADQPTIPPLPVPMSPTDAVADHPTVEMGRNVTRKISESIYDDNTIPSSLRQVQSKRLGFVVGTNSNPGIKRKYKPNEDSLLAAQGLVGNAPGPQPFGLFVIADGMGGHANGQDASRLAIQMIVENVLPKLVSDRTGSMDYAEVLVDGIQSANQAVHQQNMDKRGDMGTTITSALVVGPVAYVANVGDSRTYLYREAEGLRKVTNDHSVVASLVDAGIIKPDDIYTHPKRNQIYRSLGEKAVVDVDKFTVQLREGDKLLLCSDGLWDMVRDPKIEEVVGRPVPSPSVTGEDLVQSALEGGGEDNVSVIVVQMTEGANPEALPRVQLLAKPENVQMPQF